MALLSNLLLSRIAGGASAAETNLDNGKVWFFSSFNTYETYSSNAFCWKSPGTGTAVIEMWGPGGSGGMMCCCGGGVPGNSGAYSKKTISVNASSIVCGAMGVACGNASQIGFRGCSSATGLCWVSSTTNGCMCAEGGRGGCTMCSPTTNMFCCFYAAGYCGTVGANANCGVICNCYNGTFTPSAYGGDVNCCGNMSCTSFFSDTPAQYCQFQYHVALPAGVISTAGAVITINGELTTPSSMTASSSYIQIIHNVAAIGKNPGQGATAMACWASIVSCGCYEDNGCRHYLPIGMGGTPGQPCSSVRDHGLRGGPGAVRIRFI